MKMKISSVLLFLVLVTVFGGCHGGSLQMNFYGESCPAAEGIVKNVTWSHVESNPHLPAKLLRMNFHDCFVRGCDGSVLLNSTANNPTEKAAIPNLSLSGFDVIDDIKAKVEKACPGIVSCADIVALATRDAVSFQFKRPMWEVPTGRRDGIVSREIEALTNIPSPLFDFSTLVQRFASKNLTARDVVVLSGGHTIGVGHCARFSNRLFNFTGRGDQDPSLNPSYAAFLKSVCRSIRDTTTTVDLDPGSGLNFDSHYYRILLQRKGLFQSDAVLITNVPAKRMVLRLLRGKTFFAEFAASMKKLGEIQVLTGLQGEIRKKCWAVNSK